MQSLEQEGFAEYQAIEATVQRYVEGAPAGNGSLMRSAFADHARICGTYGGSPVEWSVENFCAMIDKNGPATDLDARVVMIEYAGNAGMARLEALNWRGTRYTGFFVLVRRDDGWRISSKVFFAHSRA
jgi:hypothetical protein